MHMDDQLEPSSAVIQGDREAVRLLLTRIRQHRLKYNWSQAEMARRSGLSRATYQDFENGYGNITLTNLAKILGVLSLTNRLAQMVPPIAEEQTLEFLTRAPRKRARSRKP
jgi:transcriptional regulator with XRE-family HTH domain